MQGCSRLLFGKGFTQGGRKQGRQPTWACTGEGRLVLGHMDLGRMDLEVATGMMPGLGELGLVVGPENK